MPNTEGLVSIIARILTIPHGEQVTKLEGEVIAAFTQSLHQLLLQQKMMIPVLQTGVPGGMELIVILVVFAISLGIPLIVTYFIYRDAKARESQHTLAWALGSFFGGLIVWLLYFFVKDEVGSGGSV